MAKWVIKTPSDYANFLGDLGVIAESITEGVDSASRDSMAEIVTDALQRSNDRAPIDTGNMIRESFAAVNGIVVAGNGAATPRTSAQEGKTVAEITYPSMSNGVNYPMIQHEHMEFDHPKGGQAKFLESVLLENGYRYAEKLKNDVINKTKG